MTITTPTVEEIVAHLNHEIEGVKAGRYSYGALSLDWMEPIRDYLQKDVDDRKFRDRVYEVAKERGADI